MQKKIIFIFILIPTLLSAQNASFSEQQFVLSHFLQKKYSKKIKAYGLAQATCFYSDKFFVIISKNKNTSPILAFSLHNGIKNINKEKDIFETFYGQINLKNNKINTKAQKEWSFWLAANRKKSLQAESYGPLIKSLFGQVNCHDDNDNIINVSNLYTPNNVAAGCVAISLSTVLNYFKWPEHGMRQKTYSDNLGHLRGEHSADFENTVYDFDHILDRYNYRSSTQVQREALGLLTYHAAVSLTTDFENGGSTSNVNRIPTALYKYWRYYGEYNSNNSDDFFTRIDSMIQKGTIVPLAISSNNGAGHAVVCSGYKIDDSGQKYYHLNMGWWGSSNGWYQIQSTFNAGGYSKIDGGVFNIVPTPELKLETTETKINLSWILPDKIAVDSFRLEMYKDGQDWVKLGVFSDVNKFNLDKNDSSKYSFRIRAYYKQFPYVISWSNYAQYEKQENTAILTKKYQNLKIFPNPATNIIYLQFPANFNKSNVKIFNLTGKILKNINLSGQKFINIDDLKAGTYILKINSQQFYAKNIFIKKE